jgi:hypothetical protein
MPGYGATASVKYAKHVSMAEEVRSAGGDWVMVCTRTYRDAARKFVKNIHDGGDANYQPASDYEAEYRMGDSDYQVWVRKAA